MSHIAFQPSGHDITLDADYVVVGSGAGGATAAVTLARGGATVVIVEAGPWRDPHDYPHSVYGAMRDLFDEWGATFTRGRAMWPIVQAVAVGGTTVINSAICVRTPEDMFARWQRDHGVGGDAMRQAVGTIQDELETELFAQVVPAASLGRSNELAMHAATKLGLPGSHYMQRFVRGCEGKGQCLQGCRAGNKQSLNLNFVPEVLRRGGHVLSSAPVQRVVMRGTTAVGVEGHFRDPVTRKRGARFVVHARRGVVVAASVTHSPLVLFRSGLRMPALGEGFRSHPGGPILGLYDDDINMSRGATQGWASVGHRLSHGVKLEVLNLPLDMLAGRIAGGGQQLMERIANYRQIAVWVQATWCEAAGSVRRGLTGRPVVRFTPSVRDMERFRDGLVMVARMHFAAGARQVLPSIHGLPYALGPDDLHLLQDGPLDPRAYVAVLSHLFGGCVMGSDPKKSVCDGRGRVHGTERLYIADASALPSGLGVNPQHTIMAVSRLWAQQMLDERVAPTSHVTGASNIAAA